MSMRQLPAQGQKLEEAMQWACVYPSSRTPGKGAEQSEWGQELAVCLSAAFSTPKERRLALGFGAFIF